MQKKYDAVVEDCTKALEYNNKYTKALFRRAKACEITNDLMQCLEGKKDCILVLNKILLDQKYRKRGFSHFTAIQIKAHGLFSWITFPTDFDFGYL